MGSQHPTRACVPTPQYPCGLSPRAGAATQPDIRARWGARGRRNSPCQTGCWHMPSKRTAPWRWLGAVKIPEKSTKVGYHATPGPPCHHRPSLICSVLLGAFFQRDPRSQLSTGAEHAAIPLLRGHSKMLQLSNSLLSTPSKRSRSEACGQHRQKAIKHDGGDGSSLAGDCGSAVTTEKDVQTSKLYLSSGKGSLSYCGQRRQAEETWQEEACPGQTASMGYIHSQGDAGCGGTAFPTVSHPHVSPWVPLHVCVLIPS